jgi:Uma2 family endonuclease
MQMATAPHLLSYEEWLRMPVVEDGTDEVVNGVLRFMPPTRYPHAEIIQRLILAMHSHIDPKQVGLLGSNLGLMISREPLTCRSPDLILYWRDKMEIRDGLYYSPPALVVEIISPSENRRRKEGKMADYARIGVPEVWLCDPTKQTLEVRRLSGGRMEAVSLLTEGVVEPLEFPSVRIAVPDIWPE